METSISPSKYELDILDEINDWKNQKTGMIERGIKIIGIPTEIASRLVSKAPGFDWAMEKTVSGLVGQLGDVARWSVRKETIYKEFRDDGYEVRNSEDIYDLDLEEIDMVIGRLRAKYNAISAGEGVATGVVGMIGVPADIISLVTLNLRAIAEYATYFGFKIADDNEHLFAMNILDYASSPNERAKKAAMGQLVKIAKAVVNKKIRNDAQQSALQKVVESIAKSLGVRLTSDKFMQYIPVAGAVVGGGTNALYTAKVCKAAHNLYRERFLMEKYGEEIIAGFTNS